MVPRLAEQTFPDDPTRANGLNVIGTTGDRALMARISQVPAAQDQTSYGGQMYDCAITLALAAIASGSTEPATVGQTVPSVTAGGRTCSTFAHCVELLAAGEDIDYDGTTGRIEIDGAGDISAARITTLTVLDGQLQPTASQDLDLVARRQQDIFASAVFVTQLQQALKVLGYFEGDITGVYDDATTAAVAALQRDLGLPDSGQFDEATEAALRDRLGVRLDAFSTSVAQLQQALADRGYYTGPIDGRWSAATIEAVKAFQRDLGVPETGVVDVATLQAIYARGIATGVASVPTTTAPPETTAPPATTTAPPPPDTTAAPTPTPAPTTPPTPPTTDAPTPEPERDDLYAVLAADPQFSSLVEVLDTAGYATDLAHPGPITFFAPTNAAFDQLDPETRDRLTSDPAAANELLRDLAVEGALTTDELTTGELTSVGGFQIEIVADGGTITVQGAPIVAPNLVASNGVAQGIGAVPDAG
jgi:peptidoglycan hydrolase-like protein with peptidoglycan-binding domain